MKLDRMFAPMQIRPGVILRVRRCHDTWIGVASEHGAFRLVALRAIAAGTRLFRIEGQTTRQPTRYTLQIDDGLHVTAGSGPGEEAAFDQFYWQFTNHSCEPNALIRARELIALRDIEAWADVTFDYNTTEYVMHEPFDCQCGSKHCLGRIKGFKHLTPEQRENRRPLLAPYLSRLLLPAAESAIP